MSTHRKRIVIIGSGLSGLAAAHRLLELAHTQDIPCDVTLLEAGPRCGGAIETVHQNGFLLEQGADSFISDKPWALDLCKRLQIDHQLMGTQNQYRRSFIVKQGRLCPVPEGLYLTVPSKLIPLFRSSLLSFSGKMRMAWEPFYPPRRNSEDESVADFLRRRFGSEAFEWIGQPMISGIYTADVEKLSALATLPKFREMEQRHGSLTRGLSAHKKQRSSIKEAGGPRYSLFLTFKQGMETLIHALVSKIPPESLRTHTAVVKLHRAAALWKVVLGNGEDIVADGVCIAAPATVASELLLPWAPEIAHSLRRVPYESIIVVHAAYPRKQIRHPLNGFGFVVPSKENRKLIGCSFSSVKFAHRAPEESVLLRTFLGGALHPELMNLSDVSLKEIVLNEFHDLLGTQGTPSLLTIRRFVKAMPQYLVGHLERVNFLEDKLKQMPGLYLTGNAYRGIGIPDCIHHAETVAQQIFAERICAS